MPFPHEFSYAYACAYLTRGNQALAVKLSLAVQLYTVIVVFNIIYKSSLTAYLKPILEHNWRSS